MKIDDKIVNYEISKHLSKLIREIIPSEPDVRADKVAELKERIESGRYEIDYEAVADKLVDELIDKL